MSRTWFWFSGIAVSLFVAMSHAAQDRAPVQSADRPRLGCVGLHGGMFELIRQHARDLGLDVEYLTGEGQRPGIACQLKSGEIV